MLCQSCKERQATVHETEIVAGGDMREVHLCEECANAQNVGTPMGVMSLLSGAFAHPAEPDASSGPGKLACSSCQLVYADFRQQGRLGCPTCYDVFADALDPLLEKIHGQRVHIGKAPGRFSSQARLSHRRVVELRKRLQRLIDDENYEEAAVLRDELHGLEDAAREAASASIQTPDDAGTSEDTVASDDLGKAEG